MSSRMIAVVALAMTVVGVNADQGTGRGAAPAAGVVAQVRTALGHGSAAEATRLVGSSQGTASDKELATALIEIYQGKDDAARARLTKLAGTPSLSEASLELGLLDMRHGRRDQAHQRLDPFVNNRQLASFDDYYRLARAARAANEIMLANDAYNQIENVKRADALSDHGDVFLRGHKPGEAVTDYKQALEVDPAWVPAQIGLVRAFSDDDPRIAHQTLETLLKQAPDDPGVWEIAAEIALSDENWAGAGKALDRLAALKPETIEEWAMRAALAYAEHRTADIEPAIQHAAAIDPTSAFPYGRVGEQASMTYQFDDDVTYHQKAVAIDPKDPAAQLDLALDLLRTGDEKDARPALEASWATDKLSPTTFNSLTLLDDLATFDVIQDGDLTFKMPKDQSGVLRLYALPLAEEAMKTFEQHYQFTPKGPILVEMFPKHDDFAVRTTGVPGILGALGACFGRVVTMDTPTARLPDEYSWQATEWHELAHVFTLQLSKYRVPRWLTEGISVFEEHRKNPAWGREVALQYAALWSQNKTFGVKGLPNAFKDPENYTIAYFEASLVVEHLVALKGDAGLRTLLLAYADGATDEQAFAKAFGDGVDAVDTSFRQFVSTQYGALAAAMKPLAGSPIDPNDVGALRQRAAGAPGSYVAQLSLGQALIKAGDEKAAVAPLQRAAELAPQAQGSGSPHALLAQIDEKAGDNAGARKELRALLVYNHDAVTAARALTKLATDAKNDADRDYGLKVTTDLAPFDADAHSALGRRELATKQYGAALVDFRSVVALGPTNPAEAHSDVAEALMGLGKKDDAKHEALLALTDAPTYARAQDLLLEASPPAAGGASAAAAAATTQATGSAATAPVATGARYAVVIEGVSGDETYAKQHRAWLDGMVSALKGKLGFDASHVSVLAETPGTGEEKSTAEVVKTTFAKLSKTTKPNDLLFVMLIGHGTGEGTDIKFNLVGPDMTVQEWNTVLAPVPGRLVFVDATSSSFPFLKGLAAPGRVIVTATRSVSEKFHTVFADGFIKAFTTDAADLDKNGRVSIWEAFAYASKQAEAHYEQDQHLSTEHALIDDAGTGTGRDATAQESSSAPASLTYLDTVATPTSSDPAMQGLYDRQRALTDQIEALRRQRASMVPEQFDRAFEPLATSLAAVSHEIRTKAGK